MTTESYTQEGALHMLLQLPYVWAAGLALIGGAEQAWLNEKIGASRQLQVGGTEADVLTLLGEPSFRWKPRPFLFWGWFDSKNEQWVYGTRVDVPEITKRGWPLPNPIPIKFRFFSTHTTDLVIRWTSAHKVESVERPETR